MPLLIGLLIISVFIFGPIFIAILSFLAAVTHYFTRKLPKKQALIFPIIYFIIALFLLFLGKSNDKISLIFSGGIFGAFAIHFTITIIGTKNPNSYFNKNEMKVVKKVENIEITIPNNEPTNDFEPDKKLTPEELNNKMQNIRETEKENTLKFKARF